MYGYHTAPLNFEYDEFTLSCTNLNGVFLYKRDNTDDNDNIEKIIHKEDCNLLINPIEPVNLPKKITSLLFIEFTKSIFISPSSTKSIYLTFPIEIGVFISDNKDNYEVLDFFTFAKKKYSIYGTPSSGSICKYWNSDTHLSIPETNPLYEGILELQITNSTGRWVEVSKTVLNAYGMKLYYNSEIVAMKVNMKITGQYIAETEFINQPILENMIKSTELYNVSKVKFVNITKYTMENGI
jgi:hypothetical protein